MTNPTSHQPTSSGIDAFEFDMADVSAPEAYVEDVSIIKSKETESICLKNSPELDFDISWANTVDSPMINNVTTAEEDDSSSVFSEMNLNLDNMEDHGDELFDWNDVLMSLSHEDEKGEPCTKTQISKITREQDTTMYGLYNNHDFEPDLSVYDNSSSRQEELTRHADPGDHRKIPANIAEKTLNNRGQNPSKKTTPKPKSKACLPIEPKVHSKSSGINTKTTQRAPKAALSDNFGFAPSGAIYSSTAKLQQSSPTFEAKEARRKRIELMLLRQRGLYQRRLRKQKQRLKRDQHLQAFCNAQNNNPTSSENHTTQSIESSFNGLDEPTISAAVAAALSVSCDSPNFPDAAVAKIAFNLINNVTQVKNKVCFKHNPTRSTLPINPPNPAFVPKTTSNPAPLFNKTPIQHNTHLPISAVVSSNMEQQNIYQHVPKQLPHTSSSSTNTSTIPCNHAESTNKTWIPSRLSFSHMLPSLTSMNIITSKTKTSSNNHNTSPVLAPPIPSTLLPPQECPSTGNTRNKPNTTKLKKASSELSNTSKNYVNTYTKNKKNNNTADCLPNTTPSSSSSKEGTCSNNNINNKTKNNLARSGVELPTGSDPESRRQRRLIRNRLSAQLHRERKREAMDTLQKEIEERDETILRLRKELRILHDKTSTLEASFAIIRHHYGNETIDRVLKSSSNLIITPKDVSSSPTPPELVSTSGSEFSDDEVTITSPISSPGHEFCETNSNNAYPTKKSDYTSSTFSQEKTSSNSNTKRKSNVSNVKSFRDKRKKCKKGTAFLVSMGTCAILGCIAILSPLTTQEEKIKITLKNKIDSSFKVSPSITDVDGIRRRLLTVDIDEESSDIYSMHPPPQAPIHSNVHENNKKSTHDWVISPIEMYPAQWEVSHNYPFSSPWTVQSSQQLFDFRSLTTLSTNSAGVDVIPLSVRSIPTAKLLSVTATKSTTSSEVNDHDNDDEIVLERVKSSSRVNRLRGSNNKIPFNSSSSTYMTNGDSLMSKNFSSSTSTATSTRTKVISPITITQSERRDMEQFVQNVNVLQSESSYVFVPDAHASWSPRFLELVDLANHNTSTTFESSIKLKKSKNNLLMSHQMSSLIKSKMYSTSKSKAARPNSMKHNDAVEPNKKSIIIKNKFNSPTTNDFNNYPSTNSGNTGTDQSSGDKALVPFSKMKFSNPFVNVMEENDNGFLKSMIGTDSDPFMSILLPASILSTDGKQNVGLKYTESETSQQWIELGCSIRSARLVDGVDFVGGSNFSQEGEASVSMEENDIDEDDELYVEVI